MDLPLKDNPEKYCIPLRRILFNVWLGWFIPTVILLFAWLRTHIVNKYCLAVSFVKVANDCIMSFYGEVLLLRAKARRERDGDEAETKAETDFSLTSHIMRIS